MAPRQTARQQQDRETTRIEVRPRRLGLLVGGSGLIGGTIVHYFKKNVPGVELMAPNSKKLSLREPEDIRRYCDKYQPDFIINTAIAAINSDAQLAYEVNYLGAIQLAEIARKRNIPFIHVSSAAVMPPGHDLDESRRLPLTARMSNYAKSKLMAELTLEHMGRHGGLDYTILRLAVVYGKHDHKIQGFHRLLFTIADRSMPVLLTSRGICHSYSHSKKLPPLIHYLLNNREEFSCQTYNFVDQKPVELAELILTIRSYLDLPTPRRIFVPYPVAKTGRTVIFWILRKMSRIGIDARLPAELMFMENFYQSQTLSPARLLNSSYRDPHAEVTVISALPELIEYYITRWQHFRLLSTFNEEFYRPDNGLEEFRQAPELLLEKIHRNRYTV
ncbi:NAD-dependent epimerase/dehydratase family protein [Thermodesulfobacteriota bacterium B35]